MNHSLTSQIEALDWLLQNWNAIQRATKTPFSSADYRKGQIMAALNQLQSLKDGGQK